MKFQSLCQTMPLKIQFYLDKQSVKAAVYSWRVVWVHVQKGSRFDQTSMSAGNKTAKLFGFKTAMFWNYWLGT